MPGACTQLLPELIFSSGPKMSRRPPTRFTDGTADRTEPLPGGWYGAVMVPERGAAGRASIWIGGTAAAAFAAYAASFLYFFVDDEAIPLVFARNLLRGRGLVYNTFEGRVEGYSDFLHVVWNAVLLAFTRAAHLRPLVALDVGKAVSFACGIAIVLLVARTLKRIGAPPPALAGALGFVALAGPLAVWSCSSLEAVPFAFGVAWLAT